MPADGAQLAADGRADGMADAVGQVAADGAQLATDGPGRCDGCRHMIIYLSIGNSDDKLSQLDWSKFITRITADVVYLANHIHGVWFSHPTSVWQNACWCLEFDDEATMKVAKETAISIRRQYRQDSVSWAVAKAEFI